MKSKLLIAAGIIILVVLGVFFLRTNQSGYQTDTQISAESGDTQIDQEQVAQKNTIPLLELAKHNALDDCWIAYDKKVYDITSFLPRHPGTPEKILPYCGSASEFERAFVKQHGTSKVSNLMKVGTFIGDFDVMGNINN